MAELKPYKNGYYLWHYLPSTVAAALFAALFSLGTAYITWKVVRTRTWFCIVFIIGGLLEIIGYCARAAAKDQTDELIPYVIQSITILVAPALLAASIYMTLGRVIRGVRAESLSLISLKWLTPIFVCGDVFSFFVQASGAGLMVKEGSTTFGQNIILAGLIIQIIMFALFVMVAAIFHNRLRQRPTGFFSDNRSKWESLMIMLYLCSVFIFVRSVFRVIEYAMGQNGYPLQNEWTLYIFDALLMLGAVAVFAWWFPSGLTLKAADDGEGFEQEMNNSYTHVRSSSSHLAK